MAAEAFARALARSGRIGDPVAGIYRTAFRLANEELRAERRRGAEPPEGSSATRARWSGLWQVVRDGEVVATVDWDSLSGTACRGSGIGGA